MDESVILMLVVTKVELLFDVHLLLYLVTIEQGQGIDYLMWKVEDVLDHSVLRELLIYTRVQMYYDRHLSVISFLYLKTVSFHG